MTCVRYQNGVAAYLSIHVQVIKVCVKTLGTELENTHGFQVLQVKSCQSTKSLTAGSSFKSPCSNFGITVW